MLTASRRNRENSYERIAEHGLIFFPIASSVDGFFTQHDREDFESLMVMFVLRPWQLYLVILCGWMNRQQQEVIGYLRTENQVLKEKLGKKRILLNDDQRRRLGVKGKVLGRKLLEEFGRLWTRSLGSWSRSRPTSGTLRLH